jgi:nucleotide-binding universal stress UspA family protein
LWRAHLAVLHTAVNRDGENAMRGPFERLAAEHGLAVAEARPGADEATVDIAAVIGREPDVVVAHQARLADLIVVPHPAGDKEMHRLERHGRICLSCDDRLAMAATRAIDTHPLVRRLSAARTTCAGSRAVPRRAPPHRRPSGFQSIKNVVGAGLLAAANEFACDLLVMGAYSHSRLRQLILGGVTRHVLEQPLSR